MLFNSFYFIFLFFPITIFVYFILNNYEHQKLAKFWLVLTSLYFYGYFNYSYLILIIASIVVNYSAGTWITNKTAFKKEVFVLGILFNVLGLGYFKYYDFFIKNLNFILKTDLPILNILLPLGISFFTFQQLSFLIDSYRGKSQNYDFLSYCLFVTFFPQLIAGPIVLPDEMLPQFETLNNKKVNYENINRGLYLFSIGLAKKVVLADSISYLANLGFDTMPSLTFVEGWITSISYTLQLYLDFSGYCDMAMGLALMFNIILPLNFNSPYKALNIQDFWQRWHMTLGRFLTNYIYIPLGGNRKSELITLRNLLIVFLISGVWHGAGWTFIVWGAFHGIAILIHRVWKNKNLFMPNFLAWLITMFFVNIFWIFFRAQNFSSAIKVLKSMFDIGSLNELISAGYKELAQPYLGKKITLILIVLSIYIILFCKNSFEKQECFELTTKNRIEKFIYFFLGLLLLNRVVPFLYFNF
ncbi:MBOAT family protein [Cetobacterium sp. 8H]|uniref:MBOAT family O-acyltransferase n=1 Tax=Cetobacterium sp. 8H TaxID=2759681 RepID=UPI00163C192A|nr:MBOAT family O-acyltransferase [Cetobacterium sp. 8H]MBC2850902.1 MBOAT family protein [Cetobacterium sp. 8H]